MVNTIFDQVQSVNITPHVDNPLPRYAVDKELFQRAVHLGITMESGAALADKQFQVDIKGLSITSGKLWCMLQPHCVAAGVYLYSVRSRSRRFNTRLWRGPSILRNEAPRTHGLMLVSWFGRISVPVKVHQKVWHVWNIMTKPQEYKTNLKSQTRAQMISLVESVIYTWLNQSETWEWDWRKGL